MPTARWSAWTLRGAFHRLRRHTERWPTAHHKEPVHPHDPALAVGRGLRALAERYPQFALSGGLLVHGTTIALNAVLQRKVARVALVVSRGTRDVLEIARCRMPSFFDFTSARKNR